MGANATTFVPSYTSGEVLTAANLSVTNSGIPVFAGTTERDAAFGGAGEKTLAEGQFAYLESTNTTQYYDGAAWQPVGASGLVRVGGGALSGASTAFTSVFSSTYGAYRIIITDAATTTANAYVRMILGATTSNYDSYCPGVVLSTGAYSSNFSGQGSASFAIGFATVSNDCLFLDVLNPNLAKRTLVSGGFFRDTNAGASATMFGTLNDTTQYTGFTVSANVGNLTGTLNIYGYALS